MSRAGSRENLFSEYRVVVEPFIGLLAGTLVRFLFTVARPMSRKYPTQDYSCLEDRISIGIIHCIDKLELDSDAILLSPLYETLLIVSLCFHQLLQIEMLGYYLLLDEVLARIVATVEINGPHECLDCIAADIGVVA